MVHAIRESVRHRNGPASRRPTVAWTIRNMLTTNTLSFGYRLNLRPSCKHQALADYRRKMALSARS